jgi:hypothetical protein
MNEIAQLTYIPQVSIRPSASSNPFRNDFVEIMDMLDKRLNDKRKNWRHIFKVSAIPRHSLRRSDSQLL